MLPDSYPSSQPSSSLALPSSTVILNSGSSGHTVVSCSCYCTCSLPASNLCSYLSFNVPSSLTSGELSLVLQNGLCYSHRISHCTCHKSIYFLFVSSSWSEDKKFMNLLELYQKCTLNSFMPHD